MAPKKARSRGVFSEQALPAFNAEQEPPADTDGEEVLGGEHLRVTVYLTVDQLDHLDRDRILIRRATRKVLERTAIIRGLVEGYLRSGVDLAALRIATEAELADFVAKQLGRSES